MVLWGIPCDASQTTSIESGPLQNKFLFFMLTLNNNYQSAVTIMSANLQ